MSVRAYASPEAFKQRLSGCGGRVVEEFGDAAILKGGLALELRLQRARTTKDVDFRMTGPASGVLTALQKAGRRDLRDFMRFEVAADEGADLIQNEGMPYEGVRFRVECQIAGKLYGQRFGVDVAFGDPIFGEPDTVEADDTLAFAGIAPPTLRLYPIETHIAEKLHAYTMPRSRTNSRVKDLPDIALLGTIQRLEAQRLRAALELTFAFRNTHPFPSRLPEPPVSWAIPYAAMARDDRLAWPTLEAVEQAARSFLDPVLAGGLDAIWESNESRWA
ncbi:MAG: nucleotidyl transferase AbiEii/AbiGii toxin family protein [Gemmatimonadaceae bacterium]|nr:nucleotidyl transferase AbiEii/AbiGii toxin family protein [Gemmatimonadaceae bacterium]